ncbi:MAG: DUF6491 family protein [Sphingopyxis sp.]|uniref:DUF6491 family protein n=1 Tax=Sphingopyxis sp. TaxID=1908224 RepID=UPI002ABAEE83|nr:DUF6491 family protein [Sphingopyxis sp.]MDZ3830475.1 DUF6491 family protein [Sphingopyxis sp.]
MPRILFLALAAALLPSAGVAAHAPDADTAAQEDAAARTLGEEASIVFPGDSSIRNWRADRDRGLWIQDRRGNWYYGSFLGSCRDIDFAHAIGVETRGTARLDRFSTIIVRGERCPLHSFVTSEGPPSKKVRKGERSGSKVPETLP